MGCFDELLKCNDLCRLLKVSGRTISRWCAAGILPAPIRLGGSRRWKASTLSTLVSHEDPASPAPEMKKTPA